MSWTSSRPYLKTPRGFRIDDTVTGRVVASGTVANGAQLQMMAAAPDMYEALKLALKALNEISHEMTVGERYTNAGQYLIEALAPGHAALAKAEGKS